MNIIFQGYPEAFIDNKRLFLASLISQNYSFIIKKTEITLSQDMMAGNAREVFGSYAINGIKKYYYLFYTLDRKDALSG